MEILHPSYEGSIYLCLRGNWYHLSGAHTPTLDPTHQNTWQTHVPTNSIIRLNHDSINISTTTMDQREPTTAGHNILTAIRIHKRQSDQSIPFDPAPVSAAVERALGYSASVILAVSFVSQSIIINFSRGTEILVWAGT